jgi:hypothetical protein
MSLSDNDYLSPGRWLTGSVPTRSPLFPEREEVRLNLASVSARQGQSTTGTVRARVFQIHKQMMDFWPSTNLGIPFATCDPPFQNRINITFTWSEKVSDTAFNGRRDYSRSGS